MNAPRVATPLDELKAAADQERSGSRQLGWVFAVVCLGPVLVILTQAESMTARLVGGGMFLLFAGIPAALLLRSGYRPVTRHPLVQAALETPGRIAGVTISYGESSPRLDVRLRPSGVAQLSVPEGTEERLATWLLSRADAPRPQP